MKMTTMTVACCVQLSLCVLCLFCCVVNVSTSASLDDWLRKTSEITKGAKTFDNVISLQNNMLRDVNIFSNSTAAALASAQKAETQLEDGTKEKVKEAIKSIKEANKMAMETNNTAALTKLSFFDVKNRMDNIKAKMEELSKEVPNIKDLAVEKMNSANKITNMTSEASSIWDKTLKNVETQLSLANQTAIATENAKTKTEDALKLLDDQGESTKAAKEELGKAKNLLETLTTDADKMKNFAADIKSKAHGASGSVRGKLQAMTKSALEGASGRLVVYNFLAIFVVFYFVCCR